MAEHLTYEQMAKKYPNRWLGINNIKYLNNDGISIESADVVYTNKSKDELFAEQFKSGAIEAWYTADESLLGVEVLDVF